MNGFLALTPHLSEKGRPPLLKAKSLSRFREWAAKNGVFHLELGFFAFILVLLNWPMLHGACNLAMVFLPGAVREGEWWRVLTHPFVHVTWYHLLLDGAAFFLLYYESKTQPLFRRMAYLFASGAGSLLIPLFTDLDLAQKGLCGLSGIGHGLMVVCALDLTSRREDELLARIGLIYFALVIGKTLVEALTGNMLFGFLYFGMVGDPVTTTHAGGVLGALIAWFVVNARRAQRAVVTTPRTQSNAS
jgi:rhomboid family GlyGly-CTERM serine protease